MLFRKFCYKGDYLWHFKSGAIFYLIKRTRSLNTCRKFFITFCKRLYMQSFIIFFHSALKTTNLKLPFFLNTRKETKSMKNKIYVWLFLPIIYHNSHLPSILIKHTFFMDFSEKSCMVWLTVFTSTQTLKILDEYIYNTFSAAARHLNLLSKVILLLLKRGLTI